MFKINKVEPANFYIDKAISMMEEFATKKRKEIDDRFFASKAVKDKSAIEINLDKRKDLELDKIRFLNENIRNSVKKIISDFPKFTKLNPVYLKLVDTNEFRVSDVEEALKRLNWIIVYADELTQNSEFKIKKSRNQQTIGFIMKKHLGKINSLFRKNKDNFAILENTRKFMNQLPTFIEMFTVAIAGFPNVGKSTLMNKITGSKVEIQNYPFTTKGLMFGYIENEKKEKEIQFIDTPGLLGRNKNNDIEKRADIIIKEYCDIIVFVFDATEICGFKTDEQLKLLRQTKAFDKKIILYFSKKDVYEKEEDEFMKENENIFKNFECFDDHKKLLEHILSIKNKKNKFDIRNIKVIR